MIKNIDFKHNIEERRWELTALIEIEDDDQFYQAVGYIPLDAKEPQLIEETVKFVRNAYLVDELKSGAKRIDALLEATEKFIEKEAKQKRVFDRWGAGGDD